MACRKLGPPPRARGRHGLRPARHPGGTTPASAGKTSTGRADCTSGADLVRDEPVSFDPRHRQWEWRTVLRHPPVRVDNPLFTGASRDPHQPMAVL